MRNQFLVFSSKTGNGDSDIIERAKLFRGAVRLPVMAKLNLSYGETPTVTVKLYGLRVADETWEELASGTYTTGTPKYLHSQGRLHGFRKYKLTLSANTNVTVDTAYIGVGVTED